MRIDGDVAVSSMQSKVKVSRLVFFWGTWFAVTSRLMTLRAWGVGKEEAVIFADAVHVDQLAYISAASIGIPALSMERPSGRCAKPGLIAIVAAGEATHCSYSLQKVYFGS